MKLRFISVYMYIFLYIRLQYNLITTRLNIIEMVFFLGQELQSEN